MIIRTLSNRFTIKLGSLALHTQLQLPIDPALFGSLSEEVEGLLVVLLDPLPVEVHEAQPALTDGVVLNE